MYDEGSHQKHVQNPRGDQNETSDPPPEIKADTIVLER